MDVTGCRPPGERHALVRAGRDIHRPVREDVEGQAAAGPDLKQAAPPLEPVGGFEQSDASHLVHVPGVARQVPAAPVAVINVRHRTSLSGLECNETDAGQLA